MLEDKGLVATQIEEVSTYHVLGPRALLALTVICTETARIMDLYGMKELRAVCMASISDRSLNLMNAT
jgi:hypothetical protein